MTLWYLELAVLVIVILLLAGSLIVITNNVIDDKGGSNDDRRDSFVRTHVLGIVLRIGRVLRR